jgi:hypothetical protein
MCCLKYESSSYSCGKKCPCPKNRPPEKEPSEKALAEELLKEGLLTEADLADYPDLEEIIQVMEDDEEQKK